MPRLVDLTPVLADGYLAFDCPLHPERHRISIPVRDGGGDKIWSISGVFPISTSTTPSVMAHSGQPKGGSYKQGDSDSWHAAAACGWHGFVTNGEVTNA